MTRIGTLDGEGGLIIDGQNVGACRYRIEISRSRSLVEGKGGVEADPRALERFFQARAAILELETGGSIGLLPLSWDRMTRIATVRVTGAIPGF